MTLLLDFQFQWISFVFLIIFFESCVLDHCFFSPPAMIFGIIDDGVVFD